MWTTIIGQIYKSVKKSEGKDPYVEWDKFQGKEKTRSINEFKQRTIRQSLRNLE